MPATRRIVVEAPISSLFRATTDPKRQCRKTIRLDGREYRCGRDHVDGIHDAFQRHGDGGLVRW